jgi:DNA-binding MarR family transcriptional regulator
MTKPIVKLVSEWAAFEEKHPGADLHTFCQYIVSRSDAKPGTRAEQIGHLARIIGRIGSAYALYHRAAMDKMNLPSNDSFFYLNCLYQLGEVRKTELINYLFAETTTGMEGISKLIKNGLAKERQDPDDGRAKLVKISEKGLRKLKECMPDAQKVNEMVFRHLSDDTINTCIQLLQATEATHSRRAIELKQKPFTDMYREMMAG